MRDHLAQLDFAPGLCNDLVLHLHLLEMEPNGRSAHVDFCSLPPTRWASLATRWTSKANQLRERRAGRDGADFQLKFAEHGRKACWHDPFSSQAPPRVRSRGVALATQMPTPRRPRRPYRTNSPRVFRWCLHAVFVARRAGYRQRDARLSRGKGGPPSAEIKR